MSLTWTEIKSGVGGLLDTTIDSTSTPSEDQVAAWVYEGALQMCEILPNSQLTPFEKVLTSSVGSFFDLTSYNVIRVTAAYKNGKPCKMLDRDEMDIIQANLIQLYDLNNPAACVATNTTATTAVKFYPADVLPCEVRFIQNPTLPMSSWLSSTSGVPPVTWRSLLVEYAVMKAKYQDEEVELSEQAHKNWQEKVQVTLGGKTIASKGA